MTIVVAATNQGLSGSSPFSETGDVSTVTINRTAPNKPTLRDPSLQTEDGSTVTTVAETPKVGSSLVDPFLALAADVLDDLEATRIANENRLRQLTRTEEDSDGEERGFGLDDRHPDVQNLTQLVGALGALEHQAELQLKRQLRRNPLGPWIKTQKGIGEKQAARLLAAIGDPYLNSSTGRPRMVSQLWAYCGLHVLPVGHSLQATHTGPAGGDQQAGGDLDHTTSDDHGRVVGVAARRKRGVKINWSQTAKSRAYLISEAMLKAGNREVYDHRKAATEGRLHQTPCVRCGPSGKPALPGSPWSNGHRHADALRVQSKEMLKLLWREARRLHEEMETQ